MKRFQEYKKGLWHLVKFQFVSALTFFLDLGVLTLLHGVLGLPVVPSNIISYSCGVLTSFFVNRQWTFKIKLKFFSLGFLRFLGITLLSLSVNTLAMHVFANMYALDTTISKLISAIFSFTINFAGNKLLVFREDSPKPDDALQ